QPVVTCDFDFQAGPLVVVVTNSVPSGSQTLPSPTHANAAVLVQPGAWWIAVGLGLLLIVIVVLLIGIRRRLNRLQAQNALVPVGSYNVVVATPTSVTTSALAEVTSTAAQAPSIAAFAKREAA